MVMIVILHNVDLVIQDRTMACIVEELLLVILLLHLLLLLTGVLKVFCA